MAYDLERRTAYTIKSALRAKAQTQYFVFCHWIETITIWPTGVRYLPYQHRRHCDFEALLRIWAGDDLNTKSFR